MKKCPYCNSVIEDNARFCLYCMKELEGKAVIDSKPAFLKKKWVLLVSAVLVFCIASGIAIGVLSKKGNPKLSAESDDAVLSSNGSTDSLGSNNDSSQTESNFKTYTDPFDRNTNKSAEQNNVNSISNSNSNVTSSINTDNYYNTDPSISVCSDLPANTNDNQAIGNITDNSSAVNESVNTTMQSYNETSVADTEETQEEISYSYRDFQKGDDFNVSLLYSDAVVITGVNSVSGDGVYSIPERIEGKKVVAVMAYAFCGEDIAATVKKIVVPSTVKTIWQNAFSACVNLTDIYFSGNSVYSDVYAFPESDKRTGTLTFHTSYDCSDRNFRNYRNSVPVYYDAVWLEWNN